MLEPQNRRHLQEALSPPHGYQFDYAVGTTYSLDLMTLLTIPLAFTILGSEQDQGHLDPLLLLDGVRRYANRIAIFCQAGQIAVPKSNQLLYHYLEESVIEVQSPSQHGVFHPKVWALRYLPETGNPLGGPVCYRLLVLSRNLTFDCSWDTMLALDGTLSTRQNAYRRLHPLGEFFAALPKLAEPRRVAPHISERVDQFQYQLRRVDFRIPTPFTEVDFFPLGLKQGKSWPFAEQKSGSLVVSPFLSKAFLDRFSHGCRDNTLISSMESLAVFGAAQLTRYAKIFVLRPQAIPEEENEKPLVAVPEPENEIPLSGLHAKLYIEERGWDAFLWTGSANATNAAFHHNVEFLARLKSKRSQIGIQQLLREGDNEQAGLLNLLRTYTPPLEPEARNLLQERLERELFAAHRRLAQAGITAVVSPNEDGFTVRLVAAKGLQLLDSVTVHCWPITLSENMSLPIRSGSAVLAEFAYLSMEALTSFFACHLTISLRGSEMSRRFVLNLPLENPPAKRQERLLRALLKDRQHVMRYLLLLLADGGNLYETDFLRRQTTTRDLDGKAGSLILPPDLFESLAQTLASDPTRLDYIERLVTELSQTDSLALLSEEFLEIWPMFQAARQALSIPDLNLTAKPDGEGAFHYETI